MPASTSSPRNCWHRPLPRPRRSSPRPTKPMLLWWCPSPGSTTEIPARSRGSSAGTVPASGEPPNRGRLGDPTYCRVRLSHDGAIADWLPERFYDSTAAIGGALSDLGCHPVYLTQLILATSPAPVSATHGSFTRRPVEDQAAVTLGYKGGAIGAAETGF